MGMVEGAALRSGTPEFGDGGDDSRDLLGFEFGIDGQGEGFLGGALGLGEVAGFVAEASVERLQVQGNRVVDGAADFALGEELLEGITVGDADGVLVEDVFAAGGNGGCGYAGDSREQF
jgi:hypothetical protein